MLNPFLPQVNDYFRNEVCIMPDGEILDELLNNKGFIIYYLNKLQGQLTTAYGLLSMASDFIQSIEYDTTMDSIQAVSILSMIQDYLTEIGGSSNDEQGHNSSD